MIKKGARLIVDSHDYEEKLREIGDAINKIPKYMENPELKKSNRKYSEIGGSIRRYCCFNFSK